MKTIAATVVLSFTFVGVAQAQTGDAPTGAFRPTRGLMMPNAALTGRADATALELNPAQLGFASDGVVLLGNLWDRETPLPGRGLGLFANAGALGFGLQRVYSSFPDARAALDGRWKMSLGLGLKMGERLSVGVSGARLFGGDYGVTNTFDAGLSLRLWNGLAFGLVVQDVFTPDILGASSRRRYTSELMLRPLGTSALEIAVGAYVVSGQQPGEAEADWSRFSPRGRIMGRIARGVSLFGEAEWNQRAPAELGTGRFATRATLGLALDFDHAGIVLAGHGAFRPDEGKAPGAGTYGGTALFRFDSTRHENVFAPRGDLVQVTLSGLDDERAFIKTSLLLSALAHDPAVAAVLIKVEELSVGAARIEELRDLFFRIRHAGKTVYLYARSGATGLVYLASAADRVFLNAAGDLDFRGQAMTNLYFKGTMSRIGVNLEVIRIKEYKGALEPFEGTEASQAVSENVNALLDDRHTRLVTAVEHDRKRPAGAPGIRELIARARFNPRDAVAVGLADEITDDEELEDNVAKSLKRKGLRAKEPDTSWRDTGRFITKTIAVVLVEGSIVESGEGRSPFSGGAVAAADTLTRTLETIRKDSQFAGVVLRINSGGGSAMASDRIARAVKKLRAAGKPVVVSMGDVAGSGGYYVAAGADAIFAQPSTLTGSIGVIHAKMDLSGLMAMAGVHTQTWKRGDKADHQSVFRAWTPQERADQEGAIRDIYDLFLQTVAEGRKSRGLTREKVDAIGRGHVWSGAQALKNGLVDKLGGLTDAIAYVGSLAKVKNTPQGLPPIVVLPSLSFFDQLRSGMGVEESASATAPLLHALPADLRRGLRALDPLLLNDKSGTGVTLTQMPFEWSPAP